MLSKPAKTGNIILVMASVALFSCSPIQVKSGRIFTKDQIGSIKKGATVKSEIVKTFGEPQMTGKDDDGLDTWGYIYLEASVPIGRGVTKETFRRLTVTFEGDTVKSMNYEISK